jgi:CRISPR-associated protein Cmr3
MTKLIELKPLTDFFFGGEATFGQDANRHYFVRSNLWPQQTSLLGMLRYELLKSEPDVFDLAQDRVTNKAEAAELIGLHGFDGSHDEAFGIIEALSPVFLLSPDDTPYFLRNRAYLEESQETFFEKISKPENNFRSMSLLDNTSAISNTGYQLMRRKAAGAVAESYDGKIPFEETLIGLKGDTLPVHCDLENKNSNGVFVRVFKTGNRKEYDGSTDDSGFFKQDFFKLKAGWRFALLAEFNTELPSAFGTVRSVPLGAERRLFRLKVDEPTVHFVGISFRDNHFINFEKLYGAETYKTPTGLAQITLLSDAKAEPDIYGKAEFSISDAVNFRHLKTNMQDPNTGWEQGNDPKSRRRQLLRRGSVFWSKSPKNIENQLQKATAFRRIGYNYFKTIQPQTI